MRRDLETDVVAETSPVAPGQLLPLMFVRRKRGETTAMATSTGLVVGELIYRFRRLEPLFTVEGRRPGSAAGSHGPILRFLSLHGNSSTNPTVSRGIRIRGSFGRAV